MDIRAILAGLAFALIWSSAFTSARIIVADAPPILSLSLRFLMFRIDWHRPCAVFGAVMAPHARAVARHHCFLGFAKMLCIWD